MCGMSKKLHEILRSIGASPETLKKEEWDEFESLKRKLPDDPEKRDEFEKLKRIVTDAIKANNRETVLEIMPRLRELADN